MVTSNSLGTYTKDLRVQGHQTILLPKNEINPKEIRAVESNTIHRAEEMAQKLQALTALPEDPGLFLAPTR